MSPPEQLPAVIETIDFVGAVHPLKAEIVDIPMPAGMTVLEMLEAAQPDPILLQDAMVFIDDVEVKREYWHVVRPRPGHVVAARIVPYLHDGGGGEGGGKNPLRTILTIAVIAAAFTFGGGLGNILLGPELAATALFGSATLLGSVVGGAVISVAGALLVNAVAPIRPPQVAALSGSGTGADSPSLFLDGARNVARPFDTVPSVLGFYRFRPPLGAKTFTEVLGDKNRLRMLLVVGLGELELSDWQIGDTPIENFEDFTLETRPGTVADAPLTVFTKQVDQDEFAIALTEPGGFQQRTSGLDADELSVDLTFPRGLMQFSDIGNRGNRTVVIEVQWRKVGDVTWLDIPATFNSTFDASNVSGPAITFTAARSVAIRHGIGWKTGERAQYEVRVRRTTLDTSSTKIFDLSFWAALRAITDEDPILFSLPLAKAALDIRATDQLSGILDTLSVLAKSVALDWDTGSGTWIERVTNNPASLFRHVLQGPGKAVPVVDAEIDLVKLQEWHEFCVANGFTFNMVRDFNSSVVDTLADIASAGRAGLDSIDGKWSVIIDQAVSTTSTHISPRNSSAFELERDFFDVPHGWRIRFPNEEEGYNQDERIVYRDGFSAATATLFERMEFPGVTNKDHIWKLGRYQGAVAVNRPENWGVTQDFESLVARRGRRVKMTHDVMLVGLASGRIKSLVADGGGNITSITVDEGLTMEAAKSYGLVIRRDVTGDVSLSVAIDLDVGTQHTVTPSPAIPVANAPEVGDLFGFGEVGQETEDALVISNVPQTEFAARVKMVPYRPAIYDADTGTIPPYVPNISAEAFLPAVEISEIVTDEAALEAGAGDTTLVTAEIRAVPINEEGAVLDVQQSFSGTGEPFYDSAIVSRGPAVVKVGAVRSNESWNFRVRWNALNKLPGAWTETNNVLIIGKSTDPAALVNPTLSIFGGQALIRWDQPSELDVQFGGEVRFRHSQSITGASWNETVSIGQVAQARTLFATMPLKLGTYMVRVFDADGNRSPVVSLSTKQADVLEFVNLDTIDEAPSFSGTHTNTITTDGNLQLQGIALMDSFGLVDDITNWDATGGITPSGTYDFATGFDLVTVKRVRLTTRITAASVDVNDFIDDRTDLMDTWENFDGTDQAETDLQVWVRHTDDDPSGSPTWSAFERLESAVFEARGFDLQARLFTNNLAFNIICSELGVDVEEVV